MAVEKFLIVDDTEGNILFFDVLLREMGKDKIYTATDATTALEVTRKQRVQFLIVAWEMEPVPGTVFIQKAVSERGQKHLPCLIFSKRMQEQDVRLTKDMGLENVLSMPFDKESARTLIEGMIHREENLDPVERKLRKIQSFVDENKPAEALKMFDHTVTKRGPFQHVVKTTLGDVWLRIGKLDRAETSLKQALEAREDHFPALNLLARVYSLSGRHEEAINLLEKLTENSPQNLTGLMSLGDAFVEADRHEEASQVYNTMRKIDEDSQDANDGDAKIAFKEGNFALAAELLRQTRNGDELASFFNNLAISCVKKGEFVKAVDTYENAIRLLEDKAKLHLLKYNLGLAYTKDKKLEDAFRILADSYLLDPTYDKAYAALVRIVRAMKEQGIVCDKQLLAKVKEARSEVENRTEQASSSDNSAA